MIFSIKEVENNVLESLVPFIEEMLLSSSELNFREILFKKSLNLNLCSWSLLNSFNLFKISLSSYSSFIFCKFTPYLQLIINSSFDF